MESGVGDSNQEGRKTGPVSKRRAVSFGARKESTGVRRTKRTRNGDGSMSLDFGTGEFSAGQRCVSLPNKVVSASVVRRVGAVLIDFLIVVGIDSAVVMLTERLAQVPIDTFREIQLLLPFAAFLMLLDCSYVVALTTFGGQTIGKMLLGIRVVLKDGGAVDFRAVMIRTLVAVLSVVPLGIGCLYMAINKGHSLHDVVAKTKVISE